MSTKYSLSSTKMNVLLKKIVSCREFKDVVFYCLCCWFIGHWVLFFVKCKVYRKVNPTAEYTKCFWWFSLQFLIYGLFMVQMCNMEVWSCPATWPESSLVTNLRAALHRGIIHEPSLLQSFMPGKVISVPGRWGRGAERLVGDRGQCGELGSETAVWLPCLVHEMTCLPRVN